MLWFWLQTRVSIALTHVKPVPMSASTMKRSTICVTALKLI
jgi:hypothetical protein